MGNVSSDYRVFPNKNWPWLSQSFLDSLKVLLFDTLSWTSKRCKNSTSIIISTSFSRWRKKKEKKSKRTREKLTSNSELVGLNLAWCLFWTTINVIAGLHSLLHWEHACFIARSSWRRTWVDNKKKKNSFLGKLPTI